MTEEHRRWTQDQLLQEAEERVVRDGRRDIACILVSADFEVKYYRQSGDTFIEVDYDER